MEKKRSDITLVTVYGQHSTSMPVKPNILKSGNSMLKFRITKHPALNTKHSTSDIQTSRNIENSLLSEMCERKKHAAATTNDSGSRIEN